MGWIEVVVGPMFSGKSEGTGFAGCDARQIGGEARAQIFKPAIDERYAANEIVVALRPWHSFGTPSSRPPRLWKSFRRARKLSVLMSAIPWR